MNAHLATDFALSPPVMCMTASGAGPFFEKAPANRAFPKNGVNRAGLAPGLLAGGLATRLRPSPASCPTLIEVAGEPFLGHQLRLIHAGASAKWFSAADSSASRSRNSRRWQQVRLSITYIMTTCSLHWCALLAALPQLGRRFLVMYGDSWLTEPVEPIWRRLSTPTNRR